MAFCWRSDEASVVEALPSCNVNLRSWWHAGKWRGPVLPGQRVFVLRSDACLGAPSVVPGHKPRLGFLLLQCTDDVSGDLFAAVATVTHTNRTAGVVGWEVAVLRTRGQLSGLRQPQSSSNHKTFPVFGITRCTCRHAVQVTAV